MDENGQAVHLGRVERVLRRDSDGDAEYYDINTDTDLYDLHSLTAGTVLGVSLNGAAVICRRSDEDWCAPLRADEVDVVFAIAQRGDPLWDRYGKVNSIYS